MDNSLANTKINDVIILSEPNTNAQTINKSLAVGTAVSALTENTLALGISAIASEPNTFVWNGVSSEMYAPTNGQGTFNINTENGVKNIYIGDKSLYDIIQDQALKIKYGQN